MTQPLPIQRVFVVGAGMIGCQISLQCSLHGCEVLVYDLNPKAFDAMAPVLEEVVAQFDREGRFPRAVSEAALAGIRRTSNPQDAVGADLIIEAVPENRAVKGKVLAQFSEICAPPAIISSTTSLFVPSQLAEFVLRPERFAVLHFTNITWSNVVEIMAHPGTSAEIVPSLENFARQVRQFPIVCRNELPGFVVNNMVMTMQYTALKLAERGVASPRDIDRAWMKTAQVKLGPFALADFMGLDTCWEITRYSSTLADDPQIERNAAFLKPYVDRGELGRKSGKGFYNYPNPEYEDPAFLEIPPPVDASLRNDPRLTSAVQSGVAGVEPRGTSGEPPGSAHLGALRSHHSPLDPSHPNRDIDSQPSQIPVGQSIAASPDSAAEPGVSKADFTMRRFVMRTVEEALPAGVPLVPTFHGPVLLLGQNASAAALKTRLAALGATVFELPVGEDAGPALAEIDRIWQTQPAPHLFLMTALDHDSAPALDDAAGWRRRSASGLMTPLLVAQRWFQHLLSTPNPERGTVAAASAMGGDFGFAGQFPAVEGGAMAGLVKAVDVETQSKLPAKVVDVSPAETAEFVAEALLREMAAARADVEVGYVDRRRHVVRAVDEDADVLPRREVPPGSVWVVTGGARGVTPIVAREFARRFGLRLHLLGTSPLQPIEPRVRALAANDPEALKRETFAAARQAGRSAEEEWARLAKAIEMDQSLCAFAEAGVTATYHACDLADRERLARVLSEIRAADGPIDGVIHGAGVEVGCAFVNKDPATVARVLAPKVEGTTNLIALTRGDPLKFFVGFGSTSARFGSMGNTDYSMANEMMTKIINYYRTTRPDCAAFSLHWTAWDDAGMSTKPKSRVALRMMNVKFMPALEGAEHTIREILAASNEREILITDHPKGVHSNHVSMPRV